MTADEEHALRSEALDLASQLLASPKDLIVRCRKLLGLLRALDVDIGRDPLLVFRAVDSEADAWPVGVDAKWLDPAYHHRCLSEMESYSQAVWAPVRDGCQALQQLLSRPD